MTMTKQIDPQTFRTGDPIVASADLALLDGALSFVHADLAEIAVQVAANEVAYRAALETAADVRQLSLLDFLR
jgi:hypothetical protein